MKFATIKNHQRRFHSFPLIISIGYLLLAGNMISCSHSAHDRQGAKGPKTTDQILFEMKTRLKLTDEQEVKVRPVIEDQVKERNEIFEKCKDHGRDGRDYLKIELKDLRLRTENRLQSLLANEQITAYGDIQQEEDRRIAGMIIEKRGQEGSKEKPTGRRSGGRGGAGRVW